jgi:diadenosine tetraphosphate (Ap4A) HIT family hydrolase
LLRIAKEEALRAVAPPASGCIMCDLVAARAHVVHETEASLVLLERFATRLGHLLVVPRIHAERVTALDEDVYLEVQRLAYRGARALERTLAAKRVYIASFGAVTPLATSCVHPHVHLVPLHDGGLVDRPASVFSWSEGILVYEPGEDEALVARLRASWT